MNHRTLHAGPLRAEIELVDGRLRSVTLPGEIPDGFDAAALADLCAQLAAYPIDLADAPPFIGAVWKRMMQIPPGSALTYGELAAEVGRPLAFRAVGQACATNRRLLAIPCHRVVAADGLGGFGPGLHWKRKLLEMEAHC